MKLNVENKCRDTNTERGNDIIQSWMKNEHVKMECL